MPKCKYHNTKFIAKYFNQKFCLSDDECIKAFNEWVKEEKQKKIQKQQKEFAVVERKYNDEKKLTASLLNTKTQVHAYVRKRDEGKPCISCNKPHEKTFEAGHHYSANSFLTLKFNLDNINGQCLYCNRHLESNFDNYALNLPNRIGTESYDKLVKLAGVDKQFSKVWNLENLKEIRDNIKKLNKEL